MEPQFEYSYFLRELKEKILIKEYSKSHTVCIKLIKRQVQYRNRTKKPKKDLLRNMFAPHPHVAVSMDSNPMTFFVNPRNVHFAMLNLNFEHFVRKTYRFV